MIRVLILGATGYIGSALAQSLLRSGQYTVYGLARNEAKAKQLAAAEIIPVIGSVTDSSAYINLIAHENINVVVDSAGANQESAKILEDLIKAGKERLQKGGAKLGFVYTSGIWVHGSSHDRVSDLDVVGTEHSKSQPPAMVAWRPQVERDVLAARDVLDTMIVRSALVYGREHGIWTGLFAPILEAVKQGKTEIQVPIEPTSWAGLIHVDDTAFGIHCAVEKLPLISGTGVYPIFDLVSSVEPMSIIFETVAKLMGFKGKVNLVAVKDNYYTKAMETSVNEDSPRAQQFLGWQPKRKGFVANLDVYVRAFMAAQAK